MTLKELSPPLSEDVVADLQAGDYVSLSGIIYTARDMAHKRLFELIEKGIDLPVNLKGAIIYYCGPTPAAPGATSGSAGPTTSNRMDMYTPALIESTGLKGMIGKGARGAEVIAAIKKHKSVYFAATGGAGALIARSIRSSKTECYEELGPEAIYRLEVKQLPLLVAIDSYGNNLYELGPRAFSANKPPN